MLPPTDRFLLRFVARFAALSAGLLLLCWAMSLLSYSEGLVVATTDGLFWLMEGDHRADTIVLEDSGDIRLHRDSRWIQSAAMPARGRYLTYSHSLVHRPYYTYSYNLLVFLALVLATPGLRWRQRCVAVAIGTGVIVMLDSLIVTADIWEVDRQYLREYLPGLRRQTSWGLLGNLVSAVHSLHPTGGAFMAPVFLWGFALMSPLLARRANRTRVVGRNDPCPCSSGRKYKACCGA